MIEFGRNVHRVRSNNNFELSSSPFSLKFSCFYFQVDTNISEELCNYSLFEKMYIEQEQSLRKGHELPEAILRNVISIHEELENLEKLYQHRHQSKVQVEFEKVISSTQFRLQKRFGGTVIVPNRLQVSSKMRSA